MEVVENPEQQKEEEKIDPQFQGIVDKINEESKLNYSNEFDQMVHSPKWTIDGHELLYQKLNHKRVGELRALQGVKIDEQKDWEAWTENYFKRGQLLIQNLTREIFDDIDFYQFENLVTAWSVRSNRGFRRHE
jgi:hypothetical protein